MSRHVFRLNCFNPRPALSWADAPKVKSSLLALSQWLLHRQQIERIEKPANPCSLGDTSETSVHGAASPSEVAGKIDVSIGAPVSNQRPCAPRATPIPHLKVVLVRDAGNPQTHPPARLVISGRMADVCAELDRLAA